MDLLRLPLKNMYNVLFFRKRSLAFDALVSIKYPLHFLSGTATVLCLAVLTYDRFLLLTEPLRYYTIMTNTRFIVLSVALWMHSALLAFAPIFWHNNQEISDLLEPIKSCIVSFFHAISIEEMIYLGMPTACLGIMSIVGMNYKIYKLASKASNAIHEMSEIYNSQRSRPESIDSQNIKANSNGNHLNLNGSTSKNNMLDFQPNNKARDSIAEQQQLQNGTSSHRRVKRNFKQAKTVLIMVACFVLGFGPYAVICGIQTYGRYFSVTLSRIEELAMYCFVSSSWVNPIIYSYRMSNFRNGVKKLLKL